MVDGSAASSVIGVANIKRSGDQRQKSDEMTGKASSKKVAPWAGRLIPFGIVLQLVIFASMLMYAFGQLFFFSDGYTTDVSVTIGNWYGYPTKATDHEEMVLPTFFFLFCFIPMAVAILLFEFLRHFSLHRITCSHALRLTRILRLKPRILGRVLHKSYGEFLFLAFVIGGNIYAFQYFYRANIAPLEEFIASVDMTTYLQTIALTFGYVCIYNMAFLFLPATRNCVWMEFLNISYANGVRYHAWFGKLTILTALLHCTGFYWSWIREGTWVEDALPCFKNCKVGEDGQYRWTNTFGTIALLCFLTIGVTSMGRIRRKMYDVFYYVHHLFIVATIFVVLHWNSTLAWLFPSIMMYAACHAVSSANAFTPVPVREFTTLSSDVVKLVLERSTTPAGEFKVGNFVYLNVPAISKLQWHPFTISSSPQTSPRSLTILLKSLGDWTQELVKYSDECKTNNILPTVYMDGFYGASLELYDEYATVCLIGGGIGVTPVLAILDDLVVRLHKSTVLSQKVFFVFTFRELSLLEEIHPLLMQIKELDPQEQYFSLHLSLTRPPTDDQLDYQIDHSRLSGKPHVSAINYDATTTKRAPVPFAGLLRSPISRVIVFTTSFFLTLLIWIIVKYGNKIQAHDENLWPLQNFVEIILVILVALLGFLVFSFVEDRKKQKSASTSGQAVAPEAVTPYTSDVHTFRDLIAEYCVEMGHRPRMNEVMRKVHQEHKKFVTSRPETVRNGNSTIGVFISGPKALKDSTANAIAEIGALDFDIHEEEFKL